MNKRRLKRAALLTGLVGLLIAGVCGIWVRSQQHQNALDHRLIVALAKYDYHQAGSLIKDGADPNTHVIPLPAPSFKQFWSYMWHRSTLPKNDSPTAFLIACGNDEEDSNFPEGQDRVDAPELVRAMLRHGANVRDRDKAGRTPLYWAASRDNAGTVGVLIDAGADVNARSPQGWTPLMIACYFLASDAIPLLLAHGADVNALDSDGSTALYHTMQTAPPNGDSKKDTTKENLLVKEILSQLLAHGAIPDLTPNGSMTALQLAQQFGSPDLVTLLRQAGAKK